MQVLQIEARDVKYKTNSAASSPKASAAATPFRFTMSPFLMCCNISGIQVALLDLARQAHSGKRLIPEQGAERTDKLREVPEPKQHIGRTSRTRRTCLCTPSSPKTSCAARTSKSEPEKGIVADISRQKRDIVADISGQKRDIFADISNSISYTEPEKSGKVL